MLADSPIKARLVAVSDTVGFGFSKALTGLGLRKRSKGLVSIVIPALEERADLLGAQALPSILRQTYEKFEVIIVSERYSPQIAGYANEFGDRCKYFWGMERDAEMVSAGGLAIWFGGATASLNFGHRKSSGQYIARLDDDDIWLPSHLANAISILENSDANFVSSRAYGPLGNHLDGIQLSDDTFGAVYKWAKLDPLVGTAITWVYESTLASIRYNPRCWKKKINRPADYDMMLRLASAGVKFAFSPLHTARKLERPSSQGIVGSQAYLAENISDED